MEILDKCLPFLLHYRALVCDVWGVLHDGITAYAESNETLTQYREQGGRVVLLSNSPQIEQQIEALLKRKGVQRSVYDELVTSGELAILQVRALNVKRVYHIGPERHSPLYENQPYARTGLDEAEAIVCTGFFNDDTGALESYVPDLKKAIKRGLPFVCGNPDILVDVGGELFLCAGAIAKRYEDLGGKVYWAGKPALLAYREAQKKIDAACGGAVSKSEILALGDALATDITGANAYGIDALFIAQGIHRKEISMNGKIDAEKLEKLFAESKLSIKAAAYSLA